MRTLRCFAPGPVSRRSLIAVFAAAAWWAGAAREARAGFLFQAGPTWRFFSLNPQAAEETPNYQGYGLDMATGYSVDRKLDVAFLVQYTPGSLGYARITNEDASFALLGGMVGATLWRQGYVAVYGGRGYYNGIKHSGRDDIVKGNFNGPAVGFSVGGILGEPKSSAESSMRLQVYTERAWMSGRRQEGAEVEKRTINTFGVGFIWAYNSLGKASWENSVMGSFLDVF